MIPRLRRNELPATAMVVVTPSEGTDEPDERVVHLASEEAARQGLRLGEYLGILDEPELGLLCHVYVASRGSER